MSGIFGGRIAVLLLLLVSPRGLFCILLRRAAKQLPQACAQPIPSGPMASSGAGGASSGAASGSAAGSDPVAERIRFLAVISTSVPGVQDQIEEWHELGRHERWRSLYMRFQDRFGIDMRYLSLVIHGNRSLIIQPDMRVVPEQHGYWFVLRFEPSPPPSSYSESVESDIDDDA